MRVGVIGAGAVTATLVEGLAAAGYDGALAVYARDPARASALARAAGGAGPVEIVAAFDDLLQWRPDVVVECAGHEAVLQFGESVLATGADFVPASLGALADDGFRSRLLDAARRGGSRIRIAAGAIGALDVIGAGRLSGIDEITYISRKPPAAWRGTPADDGTLDDLAAEAVLFEGPARQAARDYPKNANVAAAVALAGSGFDRTMVQLIADPSVRQNIHEIGLRSRCVEMTIRLAGIGSASNPRTSKTTGFSLAHTVLNLQASLVV